MHRGFYINLDRHKDRRRHMEAELKRFGLSSRYTRIPGVAHAIGALGCFQSHIMALGEARRAGGIVHIAEDDIILSDTFSEFLSSARLVTLLARFDIIFLSMWVDPRHSTLEKYQDARATAPVGGAIMDLRGARIGATDSYVVAPRSISRLQALWADGLRSGKPIDAYLDRLVQSGVVRAGVIVPFLTCIDLKAATSSAVQAMPTDDQARFVMLRTAFFADRKRQPFLEPDLPTAP